MFFNTVFLLGAIHGFVLAIVLATKKVNRLSNRIMGGLMLVFSVDLAMASFIGFETHLQFPHLIGLDFAITLFYGPLLFLYTSTLISGQPKLSGKDYLNFTPFLLLLIYTLPFYLMSGEEKIESITMDTGLNYGPRLITDLKIGINLIYVAFALVLLVRYRKRLKDNFSSLEKRNLDWLQWFILGIVILASIATITNFLSSIYGADVLYTNINLFGITIYVYSIGYMGLRQPEFFAKFEEQVGEEETEATARYSKSGLDENTAKTMMEKLTEIMEKEKPYIDNELNLSQLSDAVGISTHNLTEIINTLGGKNFYDFVNSYRVEEVKQRISEKTSGNLTILAIGLESGFNSKSSFNSVFKKHTGMTPSEFRKTVS